MIHPVVVSTYDIDKRVRTRTKAWGLEVAKLTRYEVSTDRLLYFSTLTNNPGLSGIHGSIFPDLGFQVVRFLYLEPKADDADFDYYLDIVRVIERGQRWVVRDLYLDILVYEHQHAEVLDTDEYLAAVQAGFLAQREAAFALTRTHELLNGLAEYGYSLEAYLNAQGIHLKWLADDFS